MNAREIHKLMKEDTKDKYILLSKELIDTMEKSANAKLENNSNRPLSEASIEARSVLSVIRYIRDNNIYEKNK